MLRLDTDDIFFILGLGAVIALTWFHRDASVVAYLVAGHKFISVTDDKIRDKIKTDIELK